MTVGSQEHKHNKTFQPNLTIYTNIEIKWIGRNPAYNGVQNEIKIVNFFIKLSTTDRGEIISLESAIISNGRHIPV